MPNNQIDHFLKEKLQDYSSKIPEFMWERVIAKKDKDRKFFIVWKWYLLGSVLLITFATCGYWAMKSNNKFNNNKEISSVNKETSTHQTFQEGKIDTIDKQTTATNFISNFKTNKTSFAPINPKPNLKLSSNGFLKSQQEKGKNPFLNKYVFSSSSELSLFSKTKKSNKSIARDEQNTDSTIDVSSQKRLENSNASIKEVQQDIPDSASSQNSTSQIPEQTNPKANKISQSQNNEPIQPLQSGKKGLPKYVEDRDWFIAAYGSPDIGLLNLTPDNYGFSYTLGVRIEKQFSDYFIAKAGIEYTHLNLNAGYDSFASKWIHYNTLDIPLLLGYKIKGLSFNASIDGGVIFNIYSWYSWETGNYNTNTGASIYLGFNYERTINDRLIIFTEPFFKYRLSINSPLFNQRINVTGLTFGVKYDLIKSSRKYQCN